MRILIVDDEEPARRYLREVVEEVSAASSRAIEVVGEADDGLSAIASFDRLVKDGRPPDVVLLDITMPGKNGLEVCRELMVHDHKPQVVFVTAYEQHALEAFELEAIDYLVKPADPKRVARLFRRLAGAHGDGSAKLPKGPSPDRILELIDQLTSSNNWSRLTLLDEVREVRIVVDCADILWLTSENDRTYAITVHGRLRCMETLVRLEELLPATFARSHRAFLVNLDRLEEIQPWSHGAYNLKLRGSGKTIPLSRGFAKTFKTHLNWV